MCVLIALAFFGYVSARSKLGSQLTSTSGGGIKFINSRFDMSATFSEVKQPPLQCNAAKGSLFPRCFQCALCMRCSVLCISFVRPPPSIPAPRPPSEPAPRVVTRQVYVSQGGLLEFSNSLFICPVGSQFIDVTGGLYGVNSR